jgi:hypothetical protein
VSRIALCSELRDICTGQRRVNVACMSYCPTFFTLPAVFVGLGVMAKDVGTDDPEFESKGTEGRQ